MTTIAKTLLTIAATLILTQHAQAADEDSPKETFGSVEERRIDNTILQERVNLRKEREDNDLRKKELKSLEEGVDKKLADIDRKLEELKALQKK